MEGDVEGTTDADAYALNMSLMRPSPAQSTNHGVKGFDTNLKGRKAFAEDKGL